MADLDDPEVRAMVDELELELRAQLENQVVGVVEAGVALVTWQERVTAFYEKLNAEPFETRLKHLAFLLEDVDDFPVRLADVADVTFSARVDPDADPTAFQLTIEPKIRMHRTVERVFVTATLGDRAEELMPGRCRVYWGSHGCHFERGHEGACECSCCPCADHPDPDSGCVAKPPYYGPDTRFYGDDVVARGLPLREGWS